MSRRSARGNTLVELVTLLAVMAILASVAVPSVASAKRAMAGASGARRLTLVLRVAQARAQSRSERVDVTVSAGGAYEARGATGVVLGCGELGAEPSTNYPDGGLSFNPSGSPCVLGTGTPRAGSFVFGDGEGRTVVVQLGGCVRCR